MLEEEIRSCMIKDKLLVMGFYSANAHNFLKLTKMGTEEPRWAHPAPSGQVKSATAAFPNPTGHPHPWGATGDPRPRGWSHSRAWWDTKLQKASPPQEAGQLLQPGMFWPADLCLDAGQAVTPLFQRTLTFLTQSTGQVPPAPERERCIVHLALSHKR